MGEHRVRILSWSACRRWLSAAPVFGLPLRSIEACSVAALAAMPRSAAAPVEVECPDCDSIGCVGFDKDDDSRFWPAGTCPNCAGERTVPAPCA